MSSVKQQNESRLWKEMRRNYHGIKNRFSQLPPLLTLENARKIRNRVILPGIFGIVMFEWLSRCLFRVSLWRGLLEIRTLRGPLFWWGFIICLSIVIGGWSVGRAFFHILELLWKWSRPFEAGVKK